MEMVSAAITFGIIIWAGLLFIMVKMPRKTLLRTLHHDALLDVAVVVITLWVHWGTMTGLMAATVAGLITALTTGTTKKLIGHHDGTFYHPGFWSIKY